jgi:hypothetical protein
VAGAYAPMCLIKFLLFATRKLYMLRIFFYKETSQHSAALIWYWCLVVSANILFGREKLLSVYRMHFCILEISRQPPMERAKSKERVTGNLHTWTASASSIQLRMTCSDFDLGGVARASKQTCLAVRPFPRDLVQPRTAPLSIYIYLSQPNLFT